MLNPKWIISIVTFLGKPKPIRTLLSRSRKPARTRGGYWRGLYPCQARQDDRLRRQARRPGRSRRMYRDGWRRDPSRKSNHPSLQRSTWYGIICLSLDTGIYVQLFIYCTYVVHTYTLKQANVSGIWDNLIYGNDVKERLLRYVFTAMVSKIT